MIFVKSLDDPPPGMFAAEARGLGQIAGVDGLGVPEVLAVDENWLALEWISPGRGDTASWEALGRGLAALHLRECPGFGDTEDGFIGTLPQDNAPADTWPEFYARRRIVPMAELAIHRGGLDPDCRPEVEALCARLPELCGPPEPPSLLHGDLWSGNAMIDESGRPWLIDPAAHGGHREMDLAMMALFGGFPAACLDAYDEVHPRARGHRGRVELCQLYPLLVHAALFGGGYGGRARRIMRSYL